MRTLHRLLELHLITEQDQIIRASRHRDGVGQGHLPGFVDEQKIERAFPLGSGEEPGRSADDSSAVLACARTAVWDVLQAWIGREQHAVGFATDFDSLELATTRSGGLAAGHQRLTIALWLLDAIRLFYRQPAAP